MNAPGLVGSLRSSEDVMSCSSQRQELPMAATGRRRRGSAFQPTARSQQSGGFPAGQAPRKGNPPRKKPRDSEAGPIQESVAREHLRLATLEGPALTQTSASAPKMAQSQPRRPDRAEKLTAMPAASPKTPAEVGSGMNLHRPTRRFGVISGRVSGGSTRKCETGRDNTCVLRDG